MSEGHKDQAAKNRALGIDRDAPAGIEARRADRGSPRSFIRGARQNHLAADPPLQDRPRFRSCCILLTATLIVLGLGRAAGAEVDVVALDGPGVLTKCRNWLVATSCNTYHHIRLPSHIAVGDTITLIFGSSPKEYRFSVVRIDLTGRDCTIFSQADDTREQADSIYVARCR